MAISFNDLFLKLKDSSVPPVVRGAKAMIARLTEEENRIKRMSMPQKFKPANYIKEDISEIVRKHAVKDYKPDLYIFIKPYQNF